MVERGFLPRLFSPEALEEARKAALPRRHFPGCAISARLPWCSIDKR